MALSALVAALVVGSVLLALVVSALLPFVVIGALVWLVVRIVDGLRGRRAPRVVLDSDAAADRDIGWAVGLLVAGVLWCLGRSSIAALLLGVGSAILTRGLLGMRRARV